MKNEMTSHLCLITLWNYLMEEKYFQQATLKIQNIHIEKKNKIYLLPLKKRTKFYMKRKVNNHISVEGEDKIPICIKQLVVKIKIPSWNNWKSVFLGTTKSEFALPADHIHMTLVMQGKIHKVEHCQPIWS